jgi:tyrosinase
MYKAAAALLRLPFWDWAAHPALPTVVQDPGIVINTPTGRSEVENPLFDYNFHPHDGVINGFPTANNNSVVNYPYTVRHWNNETKQNNISAANAELLANAGSLMSSTYQLFADITDYNEFSCVAPHGFQSAGTNIEVIHGNIHNMVGGVGHMTWPETSAFDPIFWLHHTQVDRLFAMWQVLNPNSYLEPSANIFGTYYEVPGSIDSVNSSLAPFHADSGTRLYTNNDVRDHARFNYAYPEIPDWALNASGLANYVRTQINRKYNSASTPQVKRGAVVKAHPMTGFEDIGLPEIRSLRVNNANFQWTIKIIVDSHAYNDVFSLDFFMGSPPKDPKLWSTAANLVGTHSQFITSSISMTRPNNLPIRVSRGEVSITHTLAAGVQRGLLADLSPAAAVPVLKDLLTWRARSANGCEIDVDTLDRLSISVGSRTSKPTLVENQFPEYGPIEWHFAATEGKPGGAQCLEA